jgi:hypothetical protein
METFVPSTERNDRSARALDTVPDQAAITAPLAPLAPMVARAPVAPTLAGTAPLAAPTRRREKLSYDVYSPDDTFRGASRVGGDVDLDGDVRHRRFALGALALVVTLGTTLAALGSCDDRREGSVSRSETTSASVTAASAAPPPAPVQLTPLDPGPPLAPVPPLGPPPKAAPKRPGIPRRIP